MKTGRITEIFPSTPPTWANPKDGSVFNRYEVRFSNGDQYTFLARGEFKRSVGEDASYEVKSQQHKTAKLVQELNAGNNAQFTPKVFNNKGVKDDRTQQFIIRQSSASTAANFFQQRNADTQEVLEFAREIEQYVNNG